MKFATPILLVLAAAAALAVPALAPRELNAQEAAPPVPVERIHDIAGLRGPRWARWDAKDSAHVLRPFGTSIGLFDSDDDGEMRLTETKPDADAVVEVLRASLPQEVAERTDFRAVWGGDAIRVRSDAEGQRRVGELLEQLRRAAAPWEFDVRAVALPADDEGAALLTELEQSGGAIPPALAARVLAADLNGGLRGGPVTAFPGVQARIERIGSRTYVLDWDVEIAQAASIADPSALTFDDGLRAYLVVRPTSGGRALVTLQATAGDVVEPVRRVDIRTKDHGSAEMPALRGAYASTEWLASAGDATAIVLAAPVGEHAVSRHVLLVRAVSGPQRTADLPVTSVPIGALTTPIDERFLALPAFEHASETCRGSLGLTWRSSAARAAADELRDRTQVRAAEALEKEGAFVSTGDGWLGDDSLVVGGDRSVAEAAVKAVSEAEAELLRPARLTVRLVSRGAGAGAAAPERTLGVVAAPALTGRNVALAAYASIPYVGDYDVEVAQEARISDPVVNVAVGGVVLNVRLSLGPANGWRADLSLVASSAGAVEIVPVTASEVGTIERVPVRRARAEQTLLFADGKPREIDLGANLWGAGRLVAVVRVER